MKIHKKTKKSLESQPDFRPGIVPKQPVDQVTAVDKRFCVELNIFYEFPVAHVDKLYHNLSPLIFIEKQILSRWQNEFQKLLDASVEQIK